MRNQRALALVSFGVFCWAIQLAACGSSGSRDSGFGDDDDGGDGKGASSSGGGGSTSSSGPGIGPGSSSSSGDGGASSGGKACATAKSVAERQPVYLDVILDGSGSMDATVNVCKSDNGICIPGTYNPGFIAACSGGRGGSCRDQTAAEADPQSPGRLTGKKWIAARDSLKAYFDAEGAVASPALGVGLYLFSSNNAGQEPVGLLDAAQAATLYGRIRPDTFPEGSTPLRASVDSQADYLRGYQSASPLLPNGRRVILLITDGVPAGVDQFDTTETTDTVKAAVTQAISGTPKVETAVLGVGNPSAAVTDYDAQFLSQLAKLGGLSADGCDENWHDGSPGTPCHLQVTPGEKTADQIKDEMIAAIDKIAGSIASCTLGLDKSNDVDPAKVNVIYVDDGGAQTQLPHDATNGWTYDDDANPSEVILHGTSCAELQGSTKGHVDIVLGCPTGTSVVN